MATENVHCGKHDKIVTPLIPCPGCETEKAGGNTGQVEIPVAPASGGASLAEAIRKARESAKK